MKKTIKRKKDHLHMKRLTLPLAVTLCLIASSCQLAPQQTPLQPASPQSQAVSTPEVAVAQPQIAQVSYTPKPAPFGQVKALPNQQLEVNFTYPDPQQFKTQIFGCGEVGSASIAVTGPALGATTIYANGSDMTTHRFPATNGCTISGIVDNIPFGDLVVTIRLYDTEGNVLAGSELISGFNVSEATPIVQMSYRQTNVGQILNQLRGTGQISDAFLAGQLDLSALQSFIDTLTNVNLTSTFPNYIFTNHPALVNIPAIVADLQANGGNIAALDPLATSQYIYTPGSVSFDVSELLTGDSLQASVDDVLSADATISSNGGVTITNLPPGTWTLRLSGPGYEDQRITVVVRAGQVTELGAVTVPPIPASLTDLTPTSGVSGSSIVINGSGFHLTAGNNTVKFGTSEANVTNATATQLTVTVPTGLALGNQTVTVAKGASQSATNLTYTVVKPVIENLNVIVGEIGSSVVITGTNFNANAGDNTVKFGTVTAIVTSASTTQLTVTVPAGIFGSVPITVVNLQSMASAAKDYAIIPKITALSLAAGSSGDTVTITGNGFDTTSSGNTVKLGANTLANPIANSTNQLQFTVPNLAAGSANATVQVGSQTSSAVAAANFVIQPRLTALTTAAVQGGKAALIREQVLTITGTNFDITPGNNIVKFGSISAAASTASATQLTVMVPDTVNTPGDIAVTVETNTRASNAITAIVPTINLNFTGEFK